MDIGGVYALIPVTSKGIRFGITGTLAKQNRPEAQAATKNRFLKRLLSWPAAIKKRGRAGSPP